MSEGDHCHVIYEDRNKYREYVCSLRGPKVNTRQEIQHSTELMLINRHVSYTAFDQLQVCCYFDKMVRQLGAIFLSCTV